MSGLGGADTAAVAARPEPQPAGQSQARTRWCGDGWQVAAWVASVVFAAAVVTLSVLLARETTGFAIQICLWLWFTILFANFAEAMAEGRGKG